MSALPDYPGLPTSKDLDEFILKMFGVLSGRCVSVTGILRQTYTKTSSLQVSDRENQVYEVKWALLLRGSHRSLQTHSDSPAERKVGEENMPPRAFDVPYMSTLPVYKLH